MAEPTITTTPEPKPFTPPKTVQPRMITPQQSKEPSKEVLSRTFTMDPSLTDEGPKVEITDSNGKVVEQTKTELPKTELPKTEVKVEPKVEPKVEEKKELPSFIKPPKGKEGEVKTDVEKKLITPQSAKKERDYSSFPAEDVPILKQMSNDAFDYFVKVSKRNQELSKQQSDIFLQHPSAYTLSPEYQQATQQINSSQVEANYWSQCLEKLDKGEPIRAPVGWNEKGQLMIGNEDIAPSKNVEEQVRMNLIKCRQFADTKTAEIQQKQTGFKNQVQQDLAAINHERKTRFSWVANPELLDYTIELDGQDTSIKQVRQTIIDLFPPYMRSSAACEVAADLFVALRIQDAELQQARSVGSVAKAKLEETKVTEPSSDARKQEEKKIGGVSRFSIADMPQ